MEENVIRVCHPTISARTRELLTEVLDKGWLGCGPITARFEKELAQYTGRKYAVGCNSGTAALDLALKVYQKEYDLRGGEMITTPMTFVSDAIIGEWAGMDVTFADIDEDTLCIDPKSIVLTDKTRAIVAVHSHGRLADIKGIRDLIESDMSGLGTSKRKILIVEDAAHAMWTPGVGQYGDITMFSFQAVKTLATADGGALTTDDEKIAKELKKLSWVGVEKTTYDRSLGRKYTWDYDITQGDGIKAYMNDVQAALALGQLWDLEDKNAKRRAIQAVYNEAFSDMPQIKIPKFSHTVQYYTMRCTDRDGLSEELAEKGIATSVHFKPLSEMTYWKKAVKRPLPVTERVWKELLTIPCHDALTWSQVEYIIKCVKDYYA